MCCERGFIPLLYNVGYNDFNVTAITVQYISIDAGSGYQLAQEWKIDDTANHAQERIIEYHTAHFDIIHAEGALNSNNCPLWTSGANVPTYTLAYFAIYKPVSQFVCFPISAANFKVTTNDVVPF